MRITYIHQHFKRPDQAGGGRPYEFARRLAARGHEVTMVCAGSDRQSYEVAGIQVEQLGVRYDNTMSVPRRILSFLSFMARSSAFVAKRPTDVVLASSTPLTTVVPGSLAAFVHRARFVFEVRDLWPQVPITMGYLPRALHAPARALERFGYWAADHVIALSPGMADGVRAVDPSVPITVIPNCADPVSGLPSRSTLRTRFGFGDDELICVYAGSLGASYDPAWLGQLGVAMQGTDWRLVVLGAGAGLAPARQRMTEAGLDADSVFLGKIPRKEAFEMLAAADTAVSSLAQVPDLEHNSLNKVFDAMALNLPVLLNHGGWLRDSLAELDAVIEVSRDPSHDEMHGLARDWPRHRLAEAGLRSGALGLSDFDRNLQAAHMETVLTQTPSETAIHGERIEG